MPFDFSPGGILFLWSLYNDRVRGDIVLAGGDAIEELDSFAGIHADLRSVLFQGVET